MKFADLARLLRTACRYRAVQLFAQIKHRMLDEGRPGVESGQAPALAATAAKTAFLPAPAHAKFDGERGFELIARPHRFDDAIDWNHQDHGPLWVYHLNQFDWARDPDLAPAARVRAIEDWIENCERGAGWAAHPISLRILSWGKLLLTSGALELDAAQSAAIRTSLAQQVETLSQRIEWRLQANHLFSNLLGVVFAGLLFEGGRAARWRAFEARLRRELSIQILPDGSHIERSPMYHGLLLENVLDLLNLALVVPGTASSGLVTDLRLVAARMLGAHRVWTHPDGEIALLSDAAFDIAHPPERLRAYAARLEVQPQDPPRYGHLDDAGVFRLDGGALTLITSAAPPSPVYQPGHAHCDALSFELSVGEERVVTDTGVTEYMAGSLREASRTTSSHATVQIDAQEQSEIWSAHRVGGRARVSVHHADAERLVMSCSPWSRPSTRHRRSFRMHQGVLEIEDQIEGPHREVRIVLPLAPELTKVVLAAEAGALEIETRGGKRLHVELPGGIAWRLERGLYFPRFGERVERETLVGKAASFAEGKWRFRLRS